MRLPAQTGARRRRGAAVPRARGDLLQRRRATRSPSRPSRQSTATGSAFDIETVASVGQVAGRLPSKEPQRLTDRVTQVVQRWFNAAYIAGDYPRNDFSTRSRASPGPRGPRRAATAT